MNHQDLRPRIIRLYNLFQAGAIPTLKQHEVHPDFERSSRENYLYFTLPPCVNYQRSSPLMWQSALHTWNDPETRFVFLPEQLAGLPFETIQKALVKYKLAIRSTKDVETWIRISSTLHTDFENDPRNILAAGNFDAQNILDLIQIEKKNLFPYLRGPKLSNYWLLILSHYTDLILTNREAISIIPDTHVLQSSVRLGLVSAKTDIAATVKAWREVLDTTGIAPVDMHSVLWNWSRNNFVPEV